MKPLPEILFKLRHAKETGNFAVLDPDEAAELLRRFVQREGLLIEARLAATGAAMSVRSYTTERLVAEINRELAP